MFGFIKKTKNTKNARKDNLSVSAPQQQPLSAKARALLQTLHVQAAAPETPESSPELTQQMLIDAMQAPPTAHITPPQITPAKTPPKRELTAATLDEKESAAKQATEEKTRAKRRKKSSKARFSRARHLREANGNLISSIIFWLFMLVILISGSISLANLYLTPIHEANQQTIGEIEQLQTTIRNSQPQIQQALAARHEREEKIELLVSTLPTTQQVKEQFNQFILRLKNAGIIVEKQEIISVDLGSDAITGIQFDASLRTNYLKYLQERNRFMRRQTFGRVPFERITANSTTNEPTTNGPTTNEIKIEIRITLPASK